MLTRMYATEHFIVFPEGDIQEISGRLRINELVDVNGTPLRPPLSTNRMIAFRVERVSVKENRGGSEIFHYLCLMSADELKAYV